MNEFLGLGEMLSNLVEIFHPGFVGEVDKCLRGQICVVDGLPYEVMILAVGRWGNDGKYFGVQYTQVSLHGFHL